MLTAPRSQESKGDDTWTGAADRLSADWTTRDEPPQDAQWELCSAPRFHEVTPVYTQAPPLSWHLAASDTPHQSAFLNLPAHGGELCFFSRQSFQEPRPDTVGLDVWLRRASCCDHDQDECVGHWAPPAVSQGAKPDPDQDVPAITLPSPLTPRMPVSGFQVVSCLHITTKRKNNCFL